MIYAKYIKKVKRKLHQETDTMVLLKKKIHPNTLKTRVYRIPKKNRKIDEEYSDQKIK